MKNMTKRMISLVMVMVMMVGVTIAVDTVAKITYNGNDEGIATSGIGTDYHIKDMFDEFKNVMPGDELTEKIEITNGVSNDINVYMNMVLHDENNQPAYDKEHAVSDGKTNTDISSMHDFISQLTMKIYVGEDTSVEPIFSAKKDDMTALLNNKYIGTLSGGRSTVLTVVLEVPETLGNEYSNRVGEVDWWFKVDEIPDPEEPTSKPTTAPTSSSTDPTSPTEPTEPTIDIDDPEIPLDPVDPDNPSSPDTGDHSNMLPYIVLFIVGLMGLILTSKKRKTN